MKSFVSRVLAYNGAFAPAAIVLSLLSFLFRFLAMNQTSFGNGWDSYFYLVQIQAWNETGSMHSPEWTLFYPILWLVNLLSPDYLTSIKITSALLASIFTLVVFNTCQRVQTSKLIVISVAAYTVFSPELTYFAAQWPKNLLGVIVLMMLLSALWKNDWKQVILFLVLGFFCHRMTALLGLGVVGFAAIQKHVPVKVWIGLFILFGVFLLVSWLLPGVLNIKDIDRLNHLVITTPQFPIISFIDLFGSDKISIAWKFELWFVVAITLLAFARIFIGNKSFKENILLLVVLLIVLWMPFYFWQIGNAAYRFFHVGVLLAPLFIIFTIPTEVNRYVQYAVITIVLSVSFFSWRSYNPQIHDPNYALYERVTQKTQEQIQQIETSPTLIIAHKSLAEFYSFSTKTDAMPWIPDYEISSDKLWRIAVLPYPVLVEHYTMQKPIHLTNNYYYIQESSWQQFVESIKKNETEALVMEHMTWQNPNEIRPAFLRKKL